MRDSYDQLMRRLTVEQFAPPPPSLERMSALEVYESFDDDPAVCEARAQLLVAEVEAWERRAFGRRRSVQAAR